MDWSTKDNIEIIYRLLNIKGIGTVQANRLLETVSYSVQTPSALEDALLHALSPLQQQAFLGDFPLASSWPVEYISILDKNRYPFGLRESLKSKSPTVLSFIGNIHLLQKQGVGFCGSRKASAKGVWIATDCATQLAKSDICVISGYANGIDLAAHKAALELGGSTIIILPEGINSFYIRKELKEVWDWERVLVISEFMPNDKWLASRAMQRNQTIIGLSCAVLVIEAGEKGGSWDAGLKSLSMGKPLFVPLYKEAPASALGNNLLLEKGASPLKLQQALGQTNLNGVMEVLKQSLFIKKENQGQVAYRQLCF